MPYLDRTAKIWVSNEADTAADRNKAAGGEIYNDIGIAALSIPIGADVHIFQFTKTLYSGRRYRVVCYVADVYSAAGSTIQSRLWIGSATSPVTYRSIATDGTIQSGGVLAWPVTVPSTQAVYFGVQIQIVGAQAGSVAVGSTIWIDDTGPVS